MKRKTALLGSLAVAVLIVAAVLVMTSASSVQANRSGEGAMTLPAPLAPAAALVTDDFDYGATAMSLTLASGGSWANHSGASPYVGYTTTGLSMAGYGSSGVGGAATIATNGSEDANRSFTPQASGTVYFAALVNVSAAGTGTYFMHLKDATASGFRARVFTKLDAGVLRFGLDTTGSAGLYATGAYTYNTTYLLVTKHTLDTGATALYILNSFSPTEPASPDVSFTSGTTLTISSVAIRQAANGPSAIIDGVRVANTWEDVVGALAASEADLGLAKSGPAVALAGDTITYTIRVSNTGTAAATGTIVTDTLPTEVAFVTYTTSLANSFTQAGNDLIWDLGDVPTDTANAKIVVEAVVSPTLANGSSFTNTVIGTTTYTETSTANNSASVTTFIGAPDLVIVKSGPAEVNAGDQVVYTLAYTNTGDIAATNVALVDQLPASFTYITDSLGSGVQSGGRITWTLGTLNPNDFGSIVLTATSSTAGDYQNVATISGNPIDSNPLDNTSSVTTTVVGVEPSVAKSGNPVVFSGETITYTLTYGNQGNLTATLTLTDQLPIGFAVADIAADTSGLAFTDGATERVWTASVAPGTSLSFTFALTVPAAISSGTRFTNTLAVSALEAGDNPANNSASAASTAYQIVPISTARAGVNGQTFAVEGQVVVVPGTYSAGEWELQDASGAIAMFYTPAPSVSLGDRIRLVATRSTFSGQQQLGLPSYFLNLGAGTPPAAKPFTTGEVLAGTAQGWLAVISGTLSNLGTCTGNYDIFVNDGSGAADVFINSFSAGVINPCANGYTNGDWVQVTGFSTIFSSTTRLAYEIRPRAISDFVRFPRVLSTDPSNGATEIPLAATITATFNMTMTNVDATNFVVMGPSGAVAGTVAYDAATKTAIFTPTAALNSNTLYTATLKAALTADNGKSFMPAQDYVWTFTTHQTTPDLSTSTKANSVNGAVKPGDWVTYTFTLNNTGDANANATITDVLSPYYTVGSLLDFTQPTTGTLTWTGVVTAGQSVTVQFVAQVKSVGQLPIGPALILNSADVSDGVHVPVVVNDPTPPTLTIYGLYLPMIRR